MRETSAAGILQVDTVYREHEVEISNDFYYDKNNPDEPDLMYPKTANKASDFFSISAIYKTQY